MTGEYEFGVTVITPVYNAACRVTKAVESALALREVGEIILVEDGSTDDSLAVCKTLERDYSKVRLLQHPDCSNHGAGASRNLGVDSARYPFIAFLDADDWYLPNRFAEDSRILLEDPSADGVYNAVSNAYDNEQVKEQWRAQGRPDILTLNESVPPEQLLSVLLWSHPSIHGEFHTDTITVRKTLLDRVGGFEPRLRLQQDTHLWNRMAAVGRLMPGSLSQPVATRGIHANNRMTRLDDQEQYRELWWNSLRVSFLGLGVSKKAMQLLRRAYVTFRAQKGPRSAAIFALASWTIRDPAQLQYAYGHFDMSLRAIFDGHPAILRLLSTKNRLLGNRQIDQAAH